VLLEIDEDEECNPVKNEKHTLGELRRIGMACSVLLALLSWVFLWQERTGGLLLTLSAFVALVLTLFQPRLLQGVYGFIYEVAEVFLGWLAQALLFLLFYLLITPLAIVARSLHIDVLALKMPEDGGSYWERGPESYWLKRKSGCSAVERQPK